MVQYIIGAVILIVIVIFSILFHKRLVKLEEKIKDISEIKINKINKIILEDKYIEKVNLLIDDFINQASEVYQIMQLSQTPNDYLKPEEAEVMKKYIFLSVKNNMTQEVQNALKSIYIINSEEDLDKILELRIKLYMINFMRQYNDVIE